MTERDDDLDFEFFEEPATQEVAAPPKPRRLPRPAARPPGPPRTPRGITPLLRLIGLIAFAILLIVLLVFWVKSCQGSSKHSAFANYMTKVSEVASTSAGIGKELNSLLTTPGTKEAALESKLNGLAQRQQQVVSKAQGINPPGQLRDEQRALVEAMQFRVSGLRGLQDAFHSTASSKSADTAAGQLSTQTLRLVTSDVVYDDLFKAPSVDVLRSEGITGVPVPDSSFFAVPDLASAAAMKPIWERLHGASTGGNPNGLHGTGIVSTKALPSGTQLSQGSVTTVTAVPGLAFEVAVQDTGNFAETGIVVTLTILRTPSPIVRTQTIDLINSGETKTVTFNDLGQPPFGTKTSVKVDVNPVPGEKSISNNTAEYSVIFTLTSP